MRLKMAKRLLPLLILLLLIIPFYQTHAENGQGDLVLFVPIEDNVERGLASFLERSIKEAREKGVDHIIFEIDTPGGRVDAASDIAKLLQTLDIPNTAFILKQALSAGSYIALNADNIYMKPTATMGASGVITADGNAADKKAQSAWIAEMTAAAEHNGRDPLYAQAMADASIHLPEYRAHEGEFLTLRPNEAVEVGYAEGIPEDRTELLTMLNLQNAQIQEIEPTLAEQIARFITDPVVVPILLSIASLGFIVELYSPGFGLPGSMGLMSLILFFYGHMIAGLAGFESIILLVLGIICIVLEFFVPGGILGFVGIGAILASLFMASADVGHMAMSVGIALIVSIIASVILFKTIGMEKGLFRHIILSEATTTEKGFVSTVNRLELIGMIGTTLTPLRPAGTAEFEDERLDVVTEGGYVQAGKSVKIVKVEGSRIVVRELSS
ncbi:membrane-bound serine protease (ClpP class) [Salirhabdus euzebyi]|uniref:Membrane-bound serine protease (ClpP class) n=1 Tax=Salirhabdus euzebyi TaxID=394506 RepID=A0A841Q7E2_9BACI|nr:nodulation protein NfeD [Salirhabdus euzebyi]MBB6454318.1 membrane-bound serine protease (ClpP class) [Salirhabdus euzebyi]